MHPALRLESNALPFTPPPRNLPPLLRRRRSGSPAGGAVCLAAGFACGDSAPRRYSVPLYHLGAAKFPSFGITRGFFPVFGKSVLRGWAGVGPPLRGPP